MANVIEVLVVGKNAAGPALASAGAQARALGGELATLNPLFGALASGGLIAAAAVAGMGIAAFNSAKHLSDVVEKLSGLSARTNVSVGDLQVMQRIIQDNGGSVESLAAALTSLNRAIGNNDPMLKALGITTRDTFTAFQQLLSALAASGDTAANTAVGMHLLGRGSAELLGQVDSLTAGLPAMRAEMQATGALLGDEVVAKLAKLDEQFDKSGRSLDGIGNRMKLLTIGPIHELIAAFNELFDAMNGLNAGSREIRKMEVDVAALREGLAKGQYWGDGVAKATAELNVLERKLVNLRTLGATYGPAPAPTDSTAGVRAAAAAADSAKKKAMSAAEAIKYVLALERQLYAVDAAKGDAGTRGATSTLKPGSPVTRKEPTATTRGLMLAEVAEAQRAMNEILNVVNITREGLASVFEGLQSGFQQAFQGIVQGTMNLRAALVSIFQSMVSAIISELARLAAASVFKFLLSLINPLGTALGSGVVGFGPSGVPYPTAVAPMGAVTNHYTIQTFSPRDVLMQTVSPQGVLRRAGASVAMAGAY